MRWWRWCVAWRRWWSITRWWRRCSSRILLQERTQSWRRWRGRRTISSILVTVSIACIAVVLNGCRRLLSPGCSITRGSTVSSIVVLGMTLLLPWCRRCSRALVVVATSTLSWLGPWCWRAGRWTFPWFGARAGAIWVRLAIHARTGLNSTCCSVRWIARQFLHKILFRLAVLQHTPYRGISLTSISLSTASPPPIRRAGAPGWPGMLFLESDPR